MARTIRMALDFALISLKTVRGPLSNVWSSAKGAIAGTAARPVVDNRVVEKLEEGLTKTTDFLIEKMIVFRDNQFEGEKAYLERELCKVNRKLREISSSAGTSSDYPTKDKSLCDTIKPCVSEAWQYAKVEMVPPMTQSFFQGIGGKTVEKFAGSISNSVTSVLRSGIASIDAAAAKRQRDIEAALKAKQDEAAAAAKKIADEKARVLAAAQAKQAEAAKAKAAQAKAAAEKAKPKAADPKKGQKDAPAAVKKPAKKPDPKKK